MGRTCHPAEPCRLCRTHTKHRWDAAAQACRADLDRLPVCPACADRLTRSYRKRSA
jgi:hypothetical protein